MADTISTTINFNGDTVYKNTYTLGGCCCRNNYINSCFTAFPSTGCMLGMAVGMAAIPFMPLIFKGACKLFSWLGKDVIVPFASAAFKGVIKPVFDNVIAPIGRKIGQGASWLAKKTGITKLWNKIFHKKSKIETKPPKAEN